jgi:hypothetical protein
MSCWGLIKKEMKTKEERKRVMLLILPVLILPLLALAFYAMGGGRPDRERIGQPGQGLNAELPAASFKKEKQADKFALYEKATQDSAGHQQDAAGAFAALGWDTAAYRKGQVKAGQASTAAPVLSADANEARIRQKLAEIEQAVHAPPAPDKPVTARDGLGGQRSSDAELMRLESMLKQPQADGGSKAADPELERLNGMLDKIAAIQNPGLLRIKDSSNAVRRRAGTVDTLFKAVPAVIDGTQKVLPGGIVRLRLTDSLVCGRLCFRKGQLLFGACTISNQRLFLDIRNVRLGRAIVPVDLTVFSMDGLPGIDAPSAELGDAAGQGAANALDNMEILGMDQSLATQAATAGISAAKGLIGRKARRVKVRLKDGYQVLLRNNGRGR